MMWIALIIVLGILAGFGNDYLKHKRKIERMKIDAMDKQLELEKTRQENFLLENRHMESELERIKADNRRLMEERKKAADSSWLIQETKTDDD
ncbi:hypothetical protein [Salinicoccus albus]|uniref:hypothetical protein n=1 Tax=Salinicoccus albus TaxID=418756 RepID=UPI00035C48CF|nr:hypothetical protein [Salinicoccus albus]